jgi:hypothetical protein
MKFLELIDTKLSPKSSFKVLSGLLMLLSPIQEVCSHAVLLGPPQRISPIPGPANQDPILENLQAVMDEWFQLPWYTGDVPFPSNYLHFVRAQFNTYLRGDLLINPCDDKIMISLIGQNFFKTLFTIPFTGSLILGRSFDRGFSWNYLPSVEPTIPLGGTISQVTTYNQTMAYNKNGKLLALIRALDLHPNPPGQVLLDRYFFSTSNDNGITWKAPTFVVAAPLDTLYLNQSGLSIEAAGFIPDPADSDLIHMGYAPYVLPETIYGAINYTSSEDGGKTWSSPIQIYNMVDDPVWVEENFDPDFTSDPRYFLYGGQSWCAFGKFAVVDEDVLLFSFFRLYPRVGSTTYTQDASNSVANKCVVRSLDNGKTWSPIAGATEQYFFPFVHDPAFATGEFDLLVPDGGENNLIVYSPITGRVYMAYMAGNPAADPDPGVYQFFPYILLSSSSDKGLTWSSPVQINLTPKNIPFANQQAFQPGLALTNDGSLVVGYYDFRNYNGGSDPNTFLQTDAWMAVYKETSDAHGGSTGVGLDVVGEIRLTPHSFDARITKNSFIRRFAPSPVGFAVNENNTLFVKFCMSNEASLSNISTGYKGMTIDTNNRSNLFMLRYQFPKPSNQ